MRYFNGKYIDHVKGDGTEFHYTWMETSNLDVLVRTENAVSESYRNQYGFLHYKDFYKDLTSLKRPVVVATVEGSLQVSSN
jgi:hypothetical protein